MNARARYRRYAGWGFALLLLALSALLLAPYLALNVSLIIVGRTVNVTDIEGEWTSRVDGAELKRNEQRLAALAPHIRPSDTFFLGWGMLQALDDRSEAALGTWAHIQERQVLYAIGKSFEQAEQYDLAISLFEQALTLENGNLGDSNLYHNIGVIEQQLRQPRQAAAALQAYQAAVAANDFPIDRHQIGDTFHFMGQIYAEQGAWPDALAAYERARQLAPGNYSLIINYASGLAQNGRSNEAIPLLEGAITAFPGRAAAYRQLAGIYAARQAWTQAIEVYENGLAAVPADPVLRAGLTVARQAMEP